MDARRTLTTILVPNILVFGMATGGHAVPSGGSIAREAATLTPTSPGQTPATREVDAPAVMTPWISTTVPSSVRSRLEASFELAARRLREVPRCRELFSDLGADGAAVLSDTLYYPAELRLEDRVCPRAHAYTVTGTAPTWVCRGFSRLSDERAAMVLLHEALHHAGLEESQDDPTRLTSHEINELVIEACGF
jgi:hypothetical protein